MSDVEQRVPATGIDNKTFSTETESQVRGDQDKVGGVIIHYPVLSFLPRRESKSK